MALKIIDIGDIQMKYGDWLPDDLKLPEHGIIIEGDKASVAACGGLLYRDVTITEAKPNAD